MATRFRPVSGQIDFPALEKELLEFWYKEGIVEKYLHKNDSSSEKFSFLDGPKTANNPLGVHHAWGRTYKDLWQRFYNMKGYKQRFQNGYDEQGLWVEVEVEKNLGLKSKRDIENIVPGDKFASLEKFINLCKERIGTYGDVITEQSKRLGQFMDWDNSYHTSSDQNNYMIWHFLKDTHQRGWLYKGHDSVPWCPRCGTAISQHEMQTEDYRELTHESIFFKLPLVDKKEEYLLVWTTTPWTIPANVAVAVNEEEEYILYPVDSQKVWVMAKTLTKLVESNILPGGKQQTKSVQGKNMVGWPYLGPFDELERVKKSLGDFKHRVVAGDPQVLPVGSDEGTGLVHVAPGAGTEDFQLGKKLGLPVIEVIDESADYLEKLGEFSGKNAKKDPMVVISHLKIYQNGKFLLATQNYTHRYPACWRCKTELVWRVVDEWYIAVDKEDPKTKETFRQKMVKVAKGIVWQPKFVEKRELDWLKNLHDWLISKKRYWGLSLPIWECNSCGKFMVVGGYDELKEKAVEGWDKFEGHSPHRPWIDQIKIKCQDCGSVSTRVPDVGNPWLDAGIVPYSTVTPIAGEVPSYLKDRKYWGEWFPPDFAVEMYEQTRLWFYAMIAMSSDLEEKPPVKRIFGHGRVVDEKGEEMHGSKGNAVSLDEAFERVGSDAMRWLYLSANPGVDLRFGFTLINEVKRRFILILWNSYKFFVDYALLADFTPGVMEMEEGNLTALDKWIVSRLNQLISGVSESLQKYDVMTASRVIEEFVVNDLSTWYIRRSRDRVGPAAEKQDEKIFLSSLYEILVAISKLLAPFMPFVSEEIYRNLTGEVSVHLIDYPAANEKLLDERLMGDMNIVRKLAEVGHAQRKEAGIKLRQPLGKFTYYLSEKLELELEEILADELNVKVTEYKKLTDGRIQGGLDTKITQSLLEEGEARELIRLIQQKRKEIGLTLKDRIKVKTPNIPAKKELVQLALRQTNATDITPANELEIELVK